MLSTQRLRNLFYFDSSYRPIPLETSFLGITEPQSQVAISRGSMLSGLHSTGLEGFGAVDDSFVV